LAQIRRTWRPDSRTVGRMMNAENYYLTSYAFSVNLGGGSLHLNETTCCREHEGLRPPIKMEVFFEGSEITAFRRNDSLSRVVQLYKIIARGSGRNVDSKSEMKSVKWREDTSVTVRTVVEPVYSTPCDCSPISTQCTAHVARFIYSFVLTPSTELEAKIIVVLGCSTRRSCA
jgi:hypothetical protein